nr:hypothetical protein BRARA_F02761 [Ipomoea batatas]
MWAALTAAAWTSRGVDVAGRGSSPASEGKLRRAESPLMDRAATSWARAAISGVANVPSQIRDFFLGSLISDTHFPQARILTPTFDYWGIEKSDGIKNDEAAGGSEVEDFQPVGLSGGLMTGAPSPGRPRGVDVYAGRGSSPGSEGKLRRAAVRPLMDTGSHPGRQSAVARASQSPSEGGRIRSAPRPSVRRFLNLEGAPRDLSSFPNGHVFQFPQAAAIPPTPTAFAARARTDGPIYKSTSLASHHLIIPRRLPGPAGASKVVRSSRPFADGLHPAR